MKQKVLEVLIGMLEGKEEGTPERPHRLSKKKGIPVYTMGELTGYVERLT